LTHEYSCTIYHRLVISGGFRAYFFEGHGGRKVQKHPKLATKSAEHSVKQKKTIRWLGPLPSPWIRHCQLSNEILKWKYTVYSSYYIDFMVGPNDRRVLHYYHWVNGIYSMLLRSAFFTGRHNIINRVPNRPNRWTKTTITSNTWQ